MKKYRAVFEIEFEAKNWKTATEYFEFFLKEMNELFYDNDVKGKLLEEIDSDVK